jgi:hypothetical protein
LVFPLAFHIAVRQPFKPSGHACCYTNLNHLEHRLLGANDIAAPDVERILQTTLKNDEIYKCLKLLKNMVTVRLTFQKH